MRSPFLKTRGDRSHPHNYSAVTVIAQVAESVSCAESSTVAVIVAVPAALPVTRPLVETVATSVSLDVHVTVKPLGTTEAVS